MPELPQLIAQGDDIEGAPEHAADAMDEVFAMDLTEDMDLPGLAKLKRGKHVVAPPPEAVAKRP